MHTMCPCVRFEHSLCRGSLMTTYIYIYISYNIYIYNIYNIYIYISIVSIKII